MTDRAMHGRPAQISAWSPSWLMAASLAALRLLPPIPQSQDYHQFADQRTLLGIPNFWSVVSNLPFIAIGAVGLLRHREDPATVVLFAGIFLTGFGSAYYHWDPNDGSLFWDRLPMTLSFSAILAGVVAERLDARTGAILLWPLLGSVCSASCGGAGPAICGSMAGRSSFRAWPCRCCSCCSPQQYTSAYYWIIAAAFYLAAKAFESPTLTSIQSAQDPERAYAQHLAAATADLASLPYLQAASQSGDCATCLERGCRRCNAGLLSSPAWRG